jgi:hypothetical protein
MPRPHSAIVSSIGKVDVPRYESVRVTDVWGSISNWYCPSANQFTICCTTLNDKLKVTVTAPCGPITEQEFKLYVKTLKRVLLKVSNYYNISVGEARRQ